MLDLDFIEACYDTSPGEEDWMASVAEALGQVVSNAASVMAAPYRVSRIDGLCYGNLSGDVRYRDDERQRANTLARRDIANLAPHREVKLRAFTNPTPSIFAVSELPRAAQAALRASLPWPAGDILGIFGTLDGTRGCVLGPSGPESFEPSRRRRQQLERLSEHLAIGYWLRGVREQRSGTDPAAAAIYLPDGKLLQREAAGMSSSLQLRLVDAVRALDQARCRRRKRSPGEATELWQGLVEGQYALVETFERSGRRLILAVRCRAPRPRLTIREAAVATAAAQGLGNKLIGERLGMARGTVAAHLQLALRKLGCPSRRLLAQWLGAQQRPWNVR